MIAAPATDSMRDFVIFFEQKEGTTAIAQLLHNFPRVEVIRSFGQWEPFDRHACGEMPLPSLRRCLDMVFSRAPLDEINHLYRQTAPRSLSRFRADASVGFKMRFHPPREEDRAGAGFAEAMTDVLGRHGVLAFVAVRQDLLRWALSRYHGDGTGRPGHLQARLASGELAREEVPRISVDPDRLGGLIESCRAMHESKRRLAAELRAAGLEVAPMRYEDLLADPAGFFSQVLGALGQEHSDEELWEALARGSRTQRVHGDDLGEFFLNAPELERRFGGEFAPW